MPAGPCERSHPMANRPQFVSLARFVGGIALLGLLAWGGYGALTREENEAAAPQEPAISTSAYEEEDRPGFDAPATDASALLLAAQEPKPAKPQPTPIAMRTTESADQALRDLREGLAMLEESRLVEAGQTLSRALASGQLDPEREGVCRGKLEAIASEVVFSRRIYPDDPHTRRYTVKPGDTLGAIVRREGLAVPHEGIALINQMPDGNMIRVGQTLKLVDGPFDAIVTKHTYTLDLYHHGMYVRSYRIGLGQNGCTPEGLWLVRPGGRVINAPWTPPPGSEQTGVIECGEPGYPLGPEGRWIALQGLDRENETFSGFGIHGTDKPDSIGKQDSSGCVRLGDADIAEVFSLLKDGHSRVLVRP